MRRPHESWCDRNHRPHQQCVSTLSGPAPDRGAYGFLKLGDPMPAPPRVVEFAERVNPEPVLTPAWRVWHAEQGDPALARAARLAESGDHAGAGVWAAIATAHYAAANVRAKPVLDSQVLSA